MPVKNEVLRRGREGRNTFYAMKRRKANWFGHRVLRNSFLKHVIEGNIERRERRGRYDKFVNCNWVAARWQQHSTHLHTSSTRNNTKQTIHRTTQNLEECGPCPVVAGIPWHLSYNWGKSTENLSQCSRREPVGTMKTHKYAIRIHRHNSEDT